MNNQPPNNDIPVTDDEVSVNPLELASQTDGSVLVPEVAEDDLVVTETPAEEPEGETAFNFLPREPLTNATLEHELFEAIDSAKWDDDAITLAIPPETQARVNEYMNNLPNVDIMETEQGAAWTENLRDGLRHGVLKDFANSAAQRKDADYRQSIKVGAKTLMAGRPKIGDDGPMLSGARGVMQVNALLGRGSIVQIPLYHSGFWITIKAPSEGRLLEMYQRMSEDKIMFGRATHGLAFANHSVFTTGSVIDLVMESIYETTVKDLGSGSELREMISQLDINTLAWGLACSVWPRGFQYTRSLLDPKGQETKMVKEKLNVAYLHWADINALDDFQRNHMAQRVTGSMSKEAINLYREHFTRGKQKEYALNDHINVVLKVPNINEYLMAGQAWVHETMATVNRAFSEDPNLEARNRQIIDQAKATTMRQYRHWVHAFEFPTIGKRMEDAETITMECDSLSGDDALRAKFFEVVQQHIVDSTVSVIATPLADDLEKERTTPRFPWLLQMDPVSTFFTLLDQKVLQIRQRT